MRFWRRLAEERGATLPEYALLVSLVVVVSMAAIQATQEEAGDRVRNSDARIGLPADAANYSVGATTTTLQATTTTTIAPAQALVVGSVTATPAPSQGSPASKWIANATITAHNGLGATVAGAVITGSWSTSGSGSTGTCTTDSSGVCTVQRADLNDGTPTERFTVTGMTKAGHTFVAGATDFGDVACSPPLTTDCD
jgi:Flp pilus assembly pilin Flp